MIGENTYSLTSESHLNIKRPLTLNTKRTSNLVLKDETNTEIFEVYVCLQTIMSHKRTPHFSHSKMPPGLNYKGQQQQDIGKDTELMCCYWCC